jgi:hypothetical protein
MIVRKFDRGEQTESWKVWIIAPYGAAEAFEKLGDNLKGLKIPFTRGQSESLWYGTATASVYTVRKCDIERLELEAKRISTYLFSLKKERI